jgi:hypothetical protein
MPIEFLSAAPKEDKKAPQSAPRTSPESGNRDLSDIGRQAEQQLPGKDAKNIYLNTLGQELKDNLSKLSPATQKKLLNADGSINQNEVARIYGLSPTFQTHITPDGKIKPPAEVPEENEEQPADATANPSKNPKIPERPANAKTGTELFREWGLNRDMNTFQPELTQRIIAEIEKGNVPDFCRNMSTVNMGNPKSTLLSFDTSNGYVAVGDNIDYIPVPLSGPMAKAIADHFGWVLPTADMAQARDAQAKVKLTVGGEHDISRMADLEWARRHNEKAKTGLQEWLAEYNKTHTPPMTDADLSRQLTAGQKKNIFIGVGATRENGGIGIGGLLTRTRDRRTGKYVYSPIQGYGYPHAGETTVDGKSGGHGDYSQSIPIIAQDITIREPGKPPKSVPLYDILRAAPPAATPPSDPNELAKYQQAVDYARYRQILNAYDGGASFDPDQAYTAPRRNAPDQNRVARNNRRPNKNRATS